MTNHVKKSNKCSQCSEAVQEDSPRYLECCETLLRLFPEDLSLGATEPVTEEADGDTTISVIMLGGESTVISYNPFMPVKQVKSLVQSKLGPQPDKQRLLYGEQELKVFRQCFYTILFEWVHVLNYSPFCQPCCSLSRVII